MIRKKFKTADFAELIGTTAKTVYKLIERGELKTVSEVINGRNIRLVISSDEEIQRFQQQYGKLTVNNGECKEILTVNESNEPLYTDNVNTSNPNNSREITALSKAIEALKYVIENTQNQTKLLTDSEHNLKESYFELNTNYQTLQIKYDALKKENEKLKSDIKELQKPWFKRIGK